MARALSEFLMRLRKRSRLQGLSSLRDVRNRSRLIGAARTCLNLRARCRVRAAVRIRSRYLGTRTEEREQA
jgi:hypothetical protein